MDVYRFCRLKDFGSLVDPAVIQDHQNSLVAIYLPHLSEEPAETLGVPFHRKGTDRFPIEGVEAHGIDRVGLGGVPAYRFPAEVPHPAAVHIGPAHRFVFEADDEFSVSDGIQRISEVFFKICSQSSGLRRSIR